MSAAAIAIDTGSLPLGGGALAILRPALSLLEPGGVVSVRSTQRSLRDDLPTWCRIEHHSYLSSEAQADGSEVHFIARGPHGVLAGRREEGLSLASGQRGYTSASVLAAAPMPEHADPRSGFAPRGAQVEPGGEAYPYALLDRERVAPPEIGQLYDQAVAGVWDAGRDIPWDRIGKLPPELESAVAQVMTFLAENELSALYVPSRFISQIHPAFAEVPMFLATQLSDEARHIDAFLKRARAAGAGVRTSSAVTSWSLLGLLELRDFTECSFLLSVLGEGTFLDLLQFIERHAPDPATAELARRARLDEARHVHFGLAHVRHVLAHDPGAAARLEDAVRRRNARIPQSGVPAPMQDALVVLAAGGTDPKSIARGHERFRELLHEMHEGRIRRMTHAGFPAEFAQRISDLHTPNFM